ncbi:FGFR1 oncogene partner 2 homolog isoform X2 [Neoarius graeffei]|uniref:FGFR1 oncogene partner 2 homolog isoform X2 n=1 Tax=Neoarius graeffei TaxID=443677 RepID=UPI00298BF8ED|nr:FGFR1 oncogene partner 2 homolog isoform X2 [Neoarius graeffei]
MSCSLEKVLTDARSLVERLRDHDNAAEILIEQTTVLNKRVEAMKQYQEEIEALNQVARHRPRSTLVMGIQQENRQIRELQQENKELRTSLEEHQSALELIMSKYREQVFRLLMASKRDDPAIVTQLKEQHTNLENRGLRELLGISREAFLVLRREERDDASDSTSLSPLVTSSDLSLRKS